MKEAALKLKKQFDATLEKNIQSNNQIQIKM